MVKKKSHNRQRKVSTGAASTHLQTLLLLNAMLFIALVPELVVETPVNPCRSTTTFLFVSVNLKTYIGVHKPVYYDVKGAQKGRVVR
jgi:hypothetical protein